MTRLHFPVSLRHLARNLALIAAGVLIIFPIYWMINLSFQTANQIFSLTPVWFPVTPVLTWYEKVFRTANFQRPLMNSLIVSISSTICVLVLSTMAAYALARLRFPLRRVLYLFIISTMMIPEQVQMIPRYLMTLRLHWTNTYHGLFVPYLGGPFGVFLLAQFLQCLVQAWVDRYPRGASLLAPQAFHLARIIDAVEPLRRRQRIELV